MSFFLKIPKDYLFLTIFLFSFLFSIFNNFYQVNKFDNYKDVKITSDRHSMIAGDIEDFYKEGDLISKQIKKGESYFNTGGEYRRPYLPSRIFALFSYLLDEELYDSEGKVKLNNGKILILLVQSLIYYALLFILYKTIINLLTKPIAMGTILFLALEPTLFMYHSSFWSESFFFSIQIFLIIFFLKKKFNLFDFFLFGLTLGIFYLQRTVAVFYIIPIFFLLYLKDKDQILKKLACVLIGYVCVHLIVGFHNYERSGKFYTFSTQAKDGFYIYLAPEILSNKLKITIPEASNLLQKRKFDWVDKNNFDLGNERHKLKYYTYQRNEAFKIILKNPLISSKVILKRTMHFVVIDPLTHVYYFHNWNHDDGFFYKSDEHEKWITPRIIYSIFIYSVCLLGLISLYKKKKDKTFLLFLILSILYFLSVQSWYGGTRYFAPILIYLSFLFSYGINFLLDKLNSLSS